MQILTMDTGERVSQFLAKEKRRIGKDILEQHFGRELRYQQNLLLGKGIHMHTPNSSVPLDAGIQALLERLQNKIDPQKIKELKKIGEDVQEELMIGNPILLQHILAQLHVPALVRKAIATATSDDGKIQVKLLLQILQSSLAPPTSVHGKVKAEDLAQLMLSMKKNPQQGAADVKPRRASTPCDQGESASTEILNDVPPPTKLEHAQTFLKDLGLPVPEEGTRACRHAGNENLNLDQVVNVLRRILDHETAQRQAHYAANFDDAQREAQLMGDPAPSPQRQSRSPFATDPLPELRAEGTRDPSLKNVTFPENGKRRKITAHQPEKQSVMEKSHQAKPQQNTEKSIPFPQKSGISIQFDEPAKDPMHAAENRRIVSTQDQSLEPNRHSRNQNAVKSASSHEEQMVIQAAKNHESLTDFGGGSHGGREFLMNESHQPFTQTISAHASSQNPGRVFQQTTHSQQTLNFHTQDWPEELAQRFGEIARKRPPARLTLHLEPEELGKLTLKVETQGTQVTAWIQTDHPHAQAILSKNAAFLEQLLAEQGLQLGGFSVDVRHENESSGNRFNHAKGKQPSSASTGIGISEAPSEAKTIHIASQEVLHQIHVTV